MDKPDDLSFTTVAISDNNKKKPKSAATEQGLKKNYYYLEYTKKGRDVQMTNTIAAIHLKDYPKQDVEININQFNDGTYCISIENIAIYGNKKIMGKLHETIEKAIYDETYEDAQEEIEKLKDQIWDLESRVKEAEGERDYYKDKYHERVFG